MSHSEVSSRGNDRGLRAETVRVSLVQKAEQHKRINSPAAASSLSVANLNSDRSRLKSPAMLFAVGYGARRLRIVKVPCHWQAKRLASNVVVRRRQRKQVLAHRKEEVMSRSLLLPALASSASAEIEGPRACGSTTMRRRFLRWQAAARGAILDSGVLSAPISSKLCRSAGVDS